MTTMTTRVFFNEKTEVEVFKKISKAMSIALDEIFPGNNPSCQKEDLEFEKILKESQSNCREGWRLSCLVYRKVSNFKEVIGSPEEWVGLYLYLKGRLHEAALSEGLEMHIPWTVSSYPGEAMLKKDLEIKFGNLPDHTAPFFGAVEIPFLTRGESPIIKITILSGT